MGLTKQLWKSLKWNLNDIWINTKNGQLSLLWFLWAIYIVGLFTVGPLGQ